MTTRNNIADILHKGVVTLLLGTTVVGLIDIGFMHKSIMAQGRETQVAREMEQLREAREASASNDTPFPQGTDLHSTASSTPR